MNVHSIVGQGEAAPKAIIESLRDVVKSGDVVNLVWNGTPSETEEAIYDYILDNEVPFVLSYTDDMKVPAAFRNAEHGTVQKVRNPEAAAVKAVEGKGKVLFRWDDTDEDSQVEWVFDLIDEGTLVLELTNGLAPIRQVSDGEIPEPQEREVEKDDDVPADDTTFTKEELENMTPISVKRYGERLGCKSKTKGGIIKELFPPEEEPDITREVEPDKPEEGEKVDAGPPVSQPTGTAESVDKSEVPQLLRIIAGNLIRLANALS